MQLQYIKAIPHAVGSRIDLHWLNPWPDLYNGVRVMRKESTHPVSPVSPNDVEFVADKENPLLFTVYVDEDSQNANRLNVTGELDNKNLCPELVADFLSHTVIVSTNAVVSVNEPGKRWQVIDNDQIYVILKNNGKLEVYGLSSLQDQGLRSETVYYYTLFPYKGNPREYLFHGGNRASAMATGPYDFAGQLYRMLPTIYHRYDKVLPAKNKTGIPVEDEQKGQLRRFLDLPGTQLDQIYSFASAALDFFNIDGVDGKLLPFLAQWIGWITDYNLEIADQRNELKKAPNLYRTIGIIPTIEAAIVKCIGGWRSRTKEFAHNVFLSNQPERMNLWMCHLDISEGWQESNDVFSLDFAYDGRPAAVRYENGTLWLFYHTQRNNRWEIWYKTYQQDQSWTPSQPLASGNSKTIDKYPTAALQVIKELDDSQQEKITNILWVFWSSYDKETQAWEIRCRKRTDGQWFDNKDKLPVTGNQRKSPQALVDQNNLLWLFWLEKVGSRWVLKYNRYNGSTWEDTSADFPLDDDGTEPRVEKDLFVLFHSKGSTYSLWVSWARKKSRGIPGQECWEIVYRQKTGVDSITEGWQPIRVLPKDPPEQSYDDCEPAAIVNQDGEIELYWASNRSGRSWALWNIKLMDIDSTGLDSAEMVINDPYSQRTPLPLLLDNSTSLVFRSNKSISYQNQVYRATKTTDFRYAGCVTVDTRNKARNAVQGMYDDFQTYSYDTGKNGIPTNNNWYARDTIGLYLKPDTDDLQLITKNQEVIKGILDRFLPIQNRAIFIIEPPIYRELIYTYDFPGEETQSLIKEQFFDSNIPEVYPGVDEKHEDKAPGWTWLCSWSEQSPDHRTVDFSKTPVVTKFRTRHVGIAQVESTSQEKKRS